MAKGKLSLTSVGALKEGLILAFTSHRDNSSCLGTCLIPSLPTSCPKSPIAFQLSVRCRTWGETPGETTDATFLETTNMSVDRERGGGAVSDCHLQGLLGWPLQ